MARMPRVAAAGLAGLLLALLGAPVDADPAAPVQVMVLGVYHMANPKRDLHNVTADDVTTPGRQAELAELAARLERFKPTKIAIEATVATPDLAYKPYRAFKPADLLQQRNERIQIGFRIARDLGLGDVYGIDADGDFPYDKVQAFATRAGGAVAASLAAMNQAVQAQVDDFTAAQKTQSVTALLARVNQPARIRADQEGYYQVLPFGDASALPGAEMNAAWYLRNAKIFAKLTQIAKPGDRVLVIFGAGHAFWLRHFATLTPGYQIVEPNDYLTTTSK